MPPPESGEVPLERLGSARQLDLVGEDAVGPEDVATVGRALRRHLAGRDDVIALDEVCWVLRLG